MNLPFRIEKRDSFRVIGYLLSTTNQKGEGKKKIPEFWEKMSVEGHQEKLFEYINQKDKGIFGISVYNTDVNDSRKFNYYIAVASDIDVGGLDTYIVPALTWAVFPCTKETVGKTEVKAITKWIPKAGYRALNKGYITGRMKSGAPDIESYKEDGSAEVWIAIQKK